MSKTTGPETRVLMLPGRDGRRVIVCEGEFDMGSQAALRQALETAHDDGITRTVVDLAGVSFADSSMLNTLIQAHRRQHLVLAGPLTPQVSRLLEISGAYALFTIAADTASTTEPTAQLP
ncbi:STAS domain-containing protein [Streptomyces enissocaesilis]|uniref:STAS domain-containing protein n=1 Tax=Streptomyces enissocaesilis TaxID=332589 RepID=A0ABP6K8S3_9ACTN